jgi:hypothetical protein
MIDEAREACAAASRCHMTNFEKLQLLRAAVNSMKNRGQASSAELADAVYALKTASALLNDARKDADKLLHELEIDCCKSWIAEGTGDSIRTEYCSATPDYKEAPRVPKAGTPEYAELLRHFGVPEDSPFKPDWNLMIERVAQDASEGKPMPAGIDVSQTWTIFKVSTRKRRPVLEDYEPLAVQDTERLKALYSAFGALLTIEPGTLEALASTIRQCEEVESSELADVSDSLSDRVGEVVVAAKEEELPF